MQGVDINAKDNRDLTPLHHLARYSYSGYSDATSDFLGSISSKEGINVLNKYINIVDYLVTKGADIEAQDREGNIC